MEDRPRRNVNLRIALIVLLGLIVSGYVVGKDMAERDNERDRSVAANRS